MSYVVLFSGGASSYCAAKRAKVELGNDGVLLFSDTRVEDADLYRFLVQSASLLAMPLVCLTAGMDLFKLAESHNALPNDRMPFCSHELKVEPAQRWIAGNAPFAPIVVGISWDESHRIQRIEKRWEGHKIICPMNEKPYLMKAQMLDEIRADGIEPPRLYAEGFAHNNCGGACVRAGHAAWDHLRKTRPETYAQWESFEEYMRAKLKKNVSILRDRTNGESSPYPLQKFRLDREAQITFDEFDWGGCGCFVDGAA